ncbi:MAG TPA: helicase-related protein [Acetobacteraceae bacterium]|jgi:N12 class adenine-specific DNA methylase/adenine-specific DNA methylase
MPTDTSEFTLGLFDNTALSSWTHHALQTVADPDEADDTDDDGNNTPPPAAGPAARGSNFHLAGDRELARGWAARARDNIAAIALSKMLEQSGRAPTADEQAQLLRFTGLGASELAQNCFRRPGEDSFRPDWQDIGAALEAAVTPEEYAALQRATQYAHYTPETIIRGLWRATERLGFTGGRVLEPGMGTGLFFALLPVALRDTCQLTGIEYDPVTARIARLVHPEARVRCEDYARSHLAGRFDLAIGNPPFSSRVVRADPATRALGLLLHDYFIARSIARLRPGGIALFVTSTGTMDKAGTTAREHIAGMADLVGAVRLPEGSMRAAAGTDVVIDVLVFQRREADQPAAGAAWIDLAAVDSAAADEEADDAGDADISGVRVNRYFAEHPKMVLGEHAMRRGIYGPAPAYTCRPRKNGMALETLLTEALDRLPGGIFIASAESLPDGHSDDGAGPVARAGTAADGATIKEGSYLLGKTGRLVQIVDGEPRPVAIKQGKSSGGILARDAKIIRALLPIRDAVREVLRAQAADQPWAEAQIRLRIAYSSFVRSFGPINHTVVSVTTDAETCEERETHRRPNLAPFADDPDCWLVASIEDYDLESGLARMGPIFRERVIAPPSAPDIATAADALAVTLNETGRVDIDHLAELLDRDPETALAQLGEAVFRNPGTEAWETDDAYLSGSVRTKLAIAEAAAERDPQYTRNVEALRRVQPEDLRPSDITARLGAPWIPAADIEAFAVEVIGNATRVRHTVEIASWSVDAAPFAGTAAGTSEWGTARRNAGWLLHDALNSAMPQIFDTIVEDGVEKRVLNSEATEAAKEKLAKIKDAFTAWVWTDPDRTDRLARLYNDCFNNLVPRRFDGRHLTLPCASSIIRLYDHQKRVIWRIVASGSTYIAHTVGAGKSYAIAGAIMEQKRLGLINKAMLVVPGHCLAQVSREFLQLYPTARILVADETNFVKEKRSRFLARAATANWDAVIITHSAFRFIPLPAGFEREMIDEQIASCADLMLRADDGDRITRKRLEAMKEKLGERLAALKSRRDDMVTLEEIGIDQIIVDEAQEFRKLSFTTNQVNLKGVDPDGSQRAWDLFVKARYLDRKRPGRALIQSSGTPITNTLGEMYTLLRFQAPEALRERGVHEFDAWASAFGDTSTELELQPSGAYKPVTRFAAFINVADLMMMFRSIADVVQKTDLRGLLTLPRIRTGQRQLVTAEASSAFKDYQRHLAQRIEAIESRKGKVQKGDDILLSVITDGRHAAIDMRLVWHGSDDEPANKLNKLIDNVHRIWAETTAQSYLRPDGTPYPIPGGGQMIFSDLGTINVEATRGFSAYRWIRQQLIARGVPAGQIAFMQDYKRSADKQRLFADFRAGRVRVLIGSSDTMGTGVNVQQRLKAMHHLDVPWLPSQIEQREGRIERQGNQHDEIDIFAYATLGSMDATMWQNNERKARFIEAALSGDRTIRRIEDAGSQANQFAMAKAIASGDSRLMRKAGLESEIARLQRQRAAHVDDQHAIRRQIRDARYDQAHAEGRITAITADLTRRQSTRGDAFTIEIEGRTTTQRKAAGASLLTKVRLAARGRIERRWTVGRIGGFDLICDIRPGRRDERLQPELVLERTDYPQSIDLDGETTPIGIIARLEHALDRMDVEIEEHRRRVVDAQARLAGFEPRLGETFPLQGELNDKLAQLAEIEADLAGTESSVNANRPA